MKMGILQLLTITFSTMMVVDLADVNTDACHQPKVEGPCKALFPRYFYNTQTSACEMFTYGGCLGNDNNFEKIETCQAKCMGLTIAG